MWTNRNRIIIDDGLCSRCFVPAKEVYHCHFPEIRAECGSIALGAAHLADQLAVYRQDAPDAWHREEIDIAIVDVTAFLKFLTDTPRDSERSCRCAPVGSRPMEATLTKSRSLSNPDTKTPPSAGFGRPASNRDMTVAPDAASYACANES